jgi:hypothetical protein
MCAILHAAAAQNCGPTGSGACCVAKAAGQCFTVHGRYGIYVENNGIWVMHERRLLSTAGDGEMDAMIYAKGGSFDYALEGDFLVCPITPRKSGHLQYVCIREHSHLKIVGRR